jgi:hypothetical protein
MTIVTDMAGPLAGAPRQKRVLARLASFTGWLRQSAISHSLSLSASARATDGAARAKANMIDARMSPPKPASTRR